MDLDFEALEELIQKEEKESQDHVSRSNDDKRSQKSLIREDNHKVISTSRSPNLSENERSSKYNPRNDEKYYNRERTRSPPRHKHESKDRSNGDVSHKRNKEERSPRDDGRHRSSRDRKERDSRDHRDYHSRERSSRRGDRNHTREEYKESEEDIKKR